jgi:HSP20 family protein
MRYFAGSINQLGRRMTMAQESWRSGRDPGPFRPIRDFEDMRRRFDEELVRPVMHAIWERIPEEAKTWAPPVDVYEKSDSLIIKAELPGLKREDIDVYVTDDTLTLKGEKKRESSVKNEDYYRSESLYGPFFRTITLPYVVDTKDIDALYEEGILRITLQRAAGSKPQKITVQVKKAPTS